MAAVVNVGTSLGKKTATGNMSKKINFLTITALYQEIPSKISSSLLQKVYKMTKETKNNLKTQWLLE